MRWKPVPRMLFFVPVSAPIVPLQPPPQEIQVPHWTVLILPVVATMTIGALVEMLA